MNLFKAIFSAPETVGKVVDAVINTGDALVFTPEEQNAANQKKLDWLLEFHKASSGSNLARRLLALSVTAVFLLFAVVAGGIVLFGGNQLSALLSVVGAFHLPELMVGIWAFYFAHRLIPGSKS